MLKNPSCIILILFVFYSSPVFADDANHLHDIKVTGRHVHSASGTQFYGTSSTLKGKELERNKSTTLGKTLEKMAGVNNEAYGPNASRPSIRSLSGNRVSILSNNLPMNDIASMSGNMGIPLDISMAEEIEVNKGSAAVIYGGKAIGGAVNVLDGKIPQAIKPQKLSGKLIQQVGSNSGHQHGVNIDINNGKDLAFNLRASRQHVSSYKIPGRTKHSACYDRDTMRSLSSSILRDQCQVFATVKEPKDPTTFKYIDTYYRDAFLNGDDVDDAEDSMYPVNDAAAYSEWAKQDLIPNPDYIEGSTERRMIVVGEPEEYATYPDKKIPNSFFKTHSFSFGSSYISDQAYIGASVSHYKSTYGVPGYAYISSKIAQKEYLPVSVGTKNTRLDIKGKIYQPTPFLSNASIFLAHTDSLDQEFVGPYESTRFKIHNNQARLELRHVTLWNRLDGVFGASVNRRNLKSSGSDAYLPSVKTSENGVFLLETLDLEPFQIGAGYALSRVRHGLNIPDDYDGGSRQGATLKDRTFNLHNKHLVLSYEPTSDWQFKVQQSFSQRAPDINELYAHGNHYANLIEEQGKSSDGMKKEKNKGLELTAKFDNEYFMAEVTAYKNTFNHFSYLRLTGLVKSRSNLLIKEWDQTDLATKGLEFNFKYRLNTATLGQWSFRVFGDLVKNKAQEKLLNAGNYLPNLPNSKYGASVEFERNNWSTFISATHFTQQKETGNTMFGGDGVFPNYTMIDMGLGYQYKLSHSQLNIDFGITNLTNTEARPNASQLKYLAPLAGRSFNLGLFYVF